MAEAYELRARAKEIRAACSAIDSDELLDEEGVRRETCGAIGLRACVESARKTGAPVVERAGRSPRIRRSVLRAWLASRKDRPKRREDEIACNDVLAKSYEREAARRAG